MRKTFDLSDKALELVKFIIEQEGHKNFTAAIHSIISNYYNDRYYNKYGKKVKLINSTEIVEKNPNENLTPEQICEMHGGIIEVINGQKMCGIKIGNAVREYTPLNDPEIKTW